MDKCICCGKAAEEILCETCRETADLKELCRKIIAYVPGSGENPVWDEIAASFDNPLNFKNIVFPITEEMDAPYRDIFRIHCISRDGSSVPKASRKWLLETVDACINDEKTDETEKSYLMGLELDALYKDYDYFGADAVAEDLAAMKDKDVHAMYTLGDFYTQTRRYEKAKQILQEGMEMYPDRLDVGLEAKLKDAQDRELGKENGGKVQFMPNPKANRDEIRALYAEFMESIGIAVEIPSSGNNRKGPEKIPRGEYPAPVETRDGGFRSFVAFDLETTGVNTKIDSITEFGAIRVVDGVVAETKEFVFSELVHPFKRKISDEVAEKTGITNEMVKDAREMWEVFPEFADFIGDDILVGFNCVRFDARFLVRAGRYSNRIITNPYFDVMRMAKDVLDRENLTLEELSAEFDIENPQAHRALADAVTTAKVYLKLLELKPEEEESLDDFLSGLDDL